MFSQEKADAICELVASGESLRKASDAVGVTHPTFLRWCNESRKLADQYARAREIGADVSFDALEDLKEDTPERGPTGTVDAGWVAWKRLQIDTAKWSLSKKAPKKYGDKLDLNHGGEMKINIQRIELVAMSDNSKG
jgi:hypothetical protein